MPRTWLTSPALGSDSVSPASRLIDDRPNFTVRRSFVSEMHNAVYLITAKSSGEQLLIDAADDVDTLASLLQEGAADSEHPASLRFIVTTHAHWDHTRATGALAARTGAKVAIGRADARQLEKERGVDADVLLEHGDRVEIEGVSLEVISLRGHTPGSIALATSDGHPALLFTGDSLFPGGVGNTGHVPERFAQLFGDVTERLFAVFDDNAQVLPGHGDPTTLGAERPSLPEWRERGW